MADGYLNFDTKINTDGFNKGLSSIGKMVSGIGNSLTKNVTKPAMVAATALGGLTLAKGWSRMVALDNAKVKLQAIGNSADAVKAIMEDALSSVKGTAYGMDEAATTAASAVAAGIKPGKQLSSYLTAVADSAAVAGIDMASMGAIFNKVATQGKANNEVLQQMAEAGIPIYQYLAEQMGVSADAVFEMASRGEVDLATFQKAVETHIGGAAKTIGSSTISGAFSNIMASISRIGSNFLGSADDANSFAGKILPLLNSVTGTLGVVEEKATLLGEKFAEAFGPIADAVTRACDSFTELDESSQNSVLKSIASGMALVVGFGPGLQILGKVVKSGSAVEATIRKVPGVFKNTGSSVKDSVGKMSEAVDELKTGVASMWLSMKDKDAAAMMGASLKGGVTTTKGALANMISAVKPFASMFVSALGFAAIAGAIIAGLGLVQGQFGDQITSFLQMVAEKGPELITNFCNGITGTLPELISQGAVLIQNLLSAITANIPAIITGGIQIIAGLVTGIAQQLPTLIPAALQMLLTIVQSLLQNIPQLINAGLQLIVGLAQGLINAVPMLIAAIPQVIQSLVSGIVQNLPTIIITGIQLLIALAVGIIQAIPQLLALIPQIFGAFIDGIMSVDWLEVGKQILTAIGEGILSIGSSLVDAVTGLFTDGETKAEESGKATGDKYAQGIESTTGNAQASATGVANATTTSFTSTLDANGELVNLSAFNMGTNANSGLMLADVPGTFLTNAQNATSGLTTSLDTGAMQANLSGYNVGTNANTGIMSANMAGTFSAAGVGAGQGLSTGISGSAGAVATAASDIAGSAQNSISSVNLGSSYSSAGQQAIQGFAAGMSSGGPAVNSAVQAVATAAIAALSSSKLSEKAKMEGTNFIKSLSNALRAGIGTIRTTVSTIMLAVKIAANGLGSAGYSAGQMFSTGLANGIKSGKNDVADAAAQVAQAAAEAAKKNLDINSPSKVGDWIGKMFDVGVANGIIRNTDKIASGVGRMTDAIESGTEEALNSLKCKAISGTAITGGYLSGAMISKTVNSRTDLGSFLDEWERRQKRLNSQRDSRPVLIDGRRIDRSIGKTGGVLV